MSTRSFRKSCIRKAVPLPSIPLPEGRVVDLPGGSTYVTRTSGPPGAPTLLLLHAVGCTGLLTWFPAIPELARRYEVVTLDQRWHGQGVMSEEFSLYDCADDVAALIEILELEDVIVTGYSMGSIVAQRVWRQHPHLVSGLVLGATTDRFRNSPKEMVFFHAMALSMGALRGLSRSRTAMAAARAAARMLDIDNPQDLHDWALAEFRSTSPWAVAQAVAALGRHHSTPWLRRIDVPTAVVVMKRDRVIPAERQRAIAARIPAATMHEADTGHAGCVLAAEAFVPVLLEACASVAARLRDRKRIESRLQLRGDVSG
ncbi:MAG TPA: alpha/beta hydrolase [Nocardioidaceae bacterium]